MAGNQRQLDNYVCASFQDPKTVLFVRLKPFSLGHIFLMKRYQIPFSSDDPNTVGGPWDLMRAVLICSMFYEEAEHFFLNENFFIQHFWDYPYALWQSFLTKLTRTSYSFRWFNRWNKILTKAFDKKKLDAIEEIQKFNEYRKTDLFIPYFDNESQDSKPSGAHWSMNVYQFLTKELNYTESRALNMPLARALVEYYKGLESLGVVRLHNDFECSIDEGRIIQ